MFKGILSTIAKTFAVLLGGGGLLTFAKLPASLRDSREEAIATVLAVLISFVLAWGLWRIGSRLSAGKAPPSSPAPDA